jgi:hypothetical protein
VGEAVSSTRGKVIEAMIWPAAIRRPIWRILLALVAVGVVLILVLSSGPADAATTFTVNKTGNAKDREISEARAAPSTHNVGGYPERASRSALL